MLDEDLAVSRDDVLIVHNHCHTVGYALETKLACH